MRARDRVPAQPSGCRSRRHFTGPLPAAVTQLNFISLKILLPISAELMKRPLASPQSLGTHAPTMRPIHLVEHRPDAVPAPLISAAGRHTRESHTPTHCDELALAGLDDDCRFGRCFLCIDDISVRRRGEMLACTACAPGERAEQPPK